MLSITSLEGSIVPNNKPRIGIISEIEKREKITDKKLNIVFRNIKKTYGFEKTKSFKIDFISLNITIRNWINYIFKY